MRSSEPLFKKPSPLTKSDKIFILTQILKQNVTVNELPANTVKQLFEFLESLNKKEITRQTSNTKYNQKVSKKQKVNVNSIILQSIIYYLIPFDYYISYEQLINILYEKTNILMSSNGISRYVLNLQARQIIQCKKIVKQSKHNLVNIKVFKRLTPITPQETIKLKQAIQTIKYKG